MIRKQKVSIASIAKELGTSPSTVSRALNGNPAISDAMAQRVREMAAKLDYVPNQMAVNLKLGKHNSIGIIVPMINRSFFASVIEGIEDYASSRGYDVVICQSKDSIEREKRLVASMRGKVDGVIASIASAQGPRDYFNNLDIPLVLFDRTDKKVNASTVTVDDFGGAKAAVEHLLGQGFRKIYHFSGPRYVDIWHQRHEGYRETMRHAGIEPLDHWSYEAPTTEENGKLFAQQILQSGELPDALFCSGDYAALGMIMEFKKHGIRIPIVGFANEPLCEVIEPRLSSVDQKSSEMGMIACRSLLDVISGEAQQNTVIEPRLIIRESSLK